MEMAKYIMEILRSQQMVMWSWGAHRFIALSGNRGLMFLVQGFKHKGWVEITYNEGRDLFDVRLLNMRKVEKEKIEDVYFDQLVDVIDAHVEMVEDNEDRVKDEYKVA